MRILVPGGTGFVGLHFVQGLLDGAAAIRVPVHLRAVPSVLPIDRLERVEADLSRYDDCVRCCTDVDWIVHAAGSVGAAGVGPQGQMEGFALNLTLALNVLRAAWECGVKRVLLFGSTTGYPPVEHPVREDEMWSADPYDGYFGYGWMRRYMERLGEFVDRSSQTRVVICRPTAVYGRHDNFDVRTAHVIPGLIRRAVDGEDPLLVWGDGSEVRDFLHVTDLVRGGLALLQHDEVLGPVNLGSGEASTVRDVATLIMESLGRSAERLRFDPTKPTAIPVRLVDLKRAHEMLGYAARVPLRDGLRDTVEWYRAQR